MYPSVEPVQGSKERCFIELRNGTIQNLKWIITLYMVLVVIVIQKYPVNAGSHCFAVTG